MKNLAGVEVNRSEHEVRTELRLARIPECPADPGVEVAARIGGAVGHFRLRRAWYYWVVTGLVPLDVAEALYADPGGRHDVRVAGNCTCPPPRDRARWVAADGRDVLDRANEAEARRYAALGDASVMGDIGAQILAESHFADDPAAFPGVEGYVEGYHIDTALGLRLFADAVTAAGLAGADLPPRHARVKLCADREDRRLRRGAYAPKPAVGAAPI